MSIKNNFIQYGVPSDWADFYESISLSITTFRQTSAKNLVEKYEVPRNQIKLVKASLTRQPIDDKVLNKLLNNNRFVCCLCKGQKSDAYIIHHIKEYSISQDNSYSNLAVLCPNDHDLAHRTGISLTNKIGEAQIRDAKKKWEIQVKKENSSLARKKLPSNPKWINPFKELQSYSINDNEFFFGRKNEINDLWSICNRYNLVGLFGESGTGKTSLINAGLLPKFHQEEFLATSIRCFDDPIRRLREQVIPILKKKINDQKFDSLISTDTFPRFIVSVKDCLASKKLSLLLVVDQFEELFTKGSEIEKEQFAKGISEALIPFDGGKLAFLFSLREDYIGELWEWTHKYNLVDAWMHQYRIKRFSFERAVEIFKAPIEKQGIKVDNNFINSTITELQKLGNGLIYPPYLQIVCFKIFEQFECGNEKTFSLQLLDKLGSVESIIADYLNETMLYGLIEEEKAHAENILDLLTSSEGLRSLLNIEDIVRFTNISPETARLVVEHLVKRKIVHPIVENDLIVGYELVHDFLSKTFFEKIGPEARRVKSIMEIFRKAFREWKQHDVLASKDRLEILFSHIEQINPTSDEWEFLLKSSFSVYYSWENKWIKKIDLQTGTNICLTILNDKNERIVESAIAYLGKNKVEASKKLLMEIFINEQKSPNIREAAMTQFGYNLVDATAIEPLKAIILRNNNHKLRKSAISALANTLIEVGDYNNHIDTIYVALNDNIAHVRKQAADVLGYRLDNPESINKLIERLEKENSVIVRKSIVSSFLYFMSDGYAKTIIPLLEKILNDPKEDYRVVEEAKNLLRYYN